MRNWANFCFIFGENEKRFLKVDTDTEISITHDLTTFCVLILSIRTLSILSLSIMSQHDPPHHDNTQHNNTMYNNAQHNNDQHNKIHHDKYIFAHCAQYVECTKY